MKRGENPVAFRYGITITDRELSMFTNSDYMS